jgi:uncharacterized protein
MSPTVEVVSLHCYPVKSCRVLDLAEAGVASAGLTHDREWMLVDGDGGFITQRTHPQLARLVPALEPGSLVLRREGRRELRLPLAASGPRRRVKVWDHVTFAFDAGDSAAAWCSEAIGAEVRLVRADPQSERRAHPQYAGESHAPLRFPDGYPILLISEESLAALNARLDRPLPMNRFRPNIVIRGAGPHAEDSIRELVAGELVLKPVKPCTRCRITKTDQASGAVSDDDEPLRTLKTYRWNRTLHGIAFGQNCVVAGGVGAMLRVGDRLSVV